MAELKKKWKSLRDVFRREFKKLLKSGQEAPDEFESSWPFFQHMLFLRNIMESRTLKGNVSPENTETGHGVEKDTEVEYKEGDLEESPQENGSFNNAVRPDEPQTPSTSKCSPSNMGPPQTTPKKEKFKRLEVDGCTNEKQGNIIPNKKKRSATVNTCDAQFLEIEKTKLKLLEESTSMKGDSDYQFLISLLPYLKKIPENRQLYVRNKLQQVLIEEQERNSFVPIHYREQPFPHQSAGHSSWLEMGTGYSSEATSDSSWPLEDGQPRVSPGTSDLKHFYNNCTEK